MAGQIDFSVLEENPAKTLGTILGVLFGLLLPSGLDYFLSLDPATIVNSPESLIIGLPIALFIEAFSGLIFGLLGLIIGAIIDSH